MSIRHALTRLLAALALVAGTAVAAPAAHAACYNGRCASVYSSAYSRGEIAWLPYAGTTYYLWPGSSSWTRDVYRFKVRPGCYGRMSGWSDTFYGGVWYNPRNASWSIRVYC